MMDALALFFQGLFFYQSSSSYSTLLWSSLLLLSELSLKKKEIRHFSFFFFFGAAQWLGAILIQSWWQLTLRDFHYLCTDRSRTKTRAESREKVGNDAI